MPSHKTHKFVDRVFLGTEHPEVHTYIDAPYRIYGFQHRRLRHDNQTSLLIGAMFGAEAMVSSELHQLADFSYSALKKARRKKK